MKKLGLERVPAPLYIPMTHSRDTFPWFIPVNEEAGLGARTGALAHSRDTFPRHIPVNEEAGLGARTGALVHSHDAFP